MCSKIPIEDKKSEIANLKNSIHSVNQLKKILVAQLTAMQQREREIEEQKKGTSK